MEITYLGHSSFRFKCKSAVIVTDPYDPSKVGLKFPEVEADIVTLSHDHPDHNAAKEVEGTPKIILHAGEYEVKGVSIFGIPTYHDDKHGEERGRNTVFVFAIEGMMVCHLGDLGHKLTEEQIGQIGNIDILLVPVGGIYTLDPKGASEAISALEPKVVIPMHYQVPGLTLSQADKLATVDEFIKEMGIEVVRDNKYIVTQDKLPPEMQVVVLERKQ